MGTFYVQFDSHLACSDCRAKCKGQDPCAQGASVSQCVSCSTLSEEQWIHLRESFAQRCLYRAGSKDDNDAPNKEEEPVFTDEDFSTDRF